MILLLGIGLRLIRLGEIPHGLTWDEAAITYDAWGISLWRRDQWAERLPLVFKSFGDYKAPLAHYALATIFFLSGEIDPIVIRMLSAAAGIVLIAVAFGLARVLFPGSKKMPLLAALLMAFSPYDIHLSRIGLEAHMAVALIGLGVLGWFLLKKEKIYGFAGILFIALSLYTYQSPKIVVPLLILVWVALFRSQLQQKRRYFLALLGLFVLLVVPLLFSLKSGGGARAEQALLFFENGSMKFSMADAKALGNNILAHLSPDFWVKGVQDNLRHIVPGYGLLYLIELPFFILGLLVLLWRRKRTDLFLVSWFFIGLLPSVIGRVSPHAIRAATIIPVVYLIEAIGLQTAFTFIRHKAGLRIAQVLLMGFLMGYVASLVNFERDYFGTYALDSARDFQYGYKEVYQVLEKQAQSADKVVFTDAYGQPYIYSLLYRKITPKDYQSGALANYEFRAIHWPEDRKNTVFVGTPEEIPLSDKRVLEVVTYPHSPEIVFVIARTP